MFSSVRRWLETALGHRRTTNRCAAECQGAPILSKYTALPTHIPLALSLPTTTTAHPYPSATLRFVRRIKLEGALAVMDYLAEQREKVQEPRVGEWRRWGSVTMTNPPPQLALSCTFRASGGGISEDVA